MIKLLQTILFTILFIISGDVFSQYSDKEQVQIDSLSAIITNSKDDLQKVKAYADLYAVLYVQNLDTVIDLANQIIIISNENLKHDISKEDEFLYKKYLASAISDIGYVYDDYGRIKEASKKYYEALKIQEEIGDKKGASSSLNNLGLLFDGQGESEKALDFYFKSIKLSKELGDGPSLAVNYVNIGAIYRNKNELDLALEYFFKSLDLRDTTEYFELANSYSNIGLAYAEDKQFEKAFTYLNKALSLRIELGDEEGVALSYVNLSDFYYTKNDMLNAKKNAEKAYQLCKDLGIPEDVQISTEILSEIHKKLKNYKEGWEFYEIYIQTRDKLRNDENITSIIEQNSQFEFDKKQAIKEAEHQKDLEIFAEKEKSQKLITLAVIVILLVVFLSLIIIVKRLKVTRKQKKVIEFQKQDIVDSITYAKRIQEAILPTIAAIKKVLPNNFIYYKPKDIIAGDFYWVEEVGNKVFFAVADCTGHGVPGAMVSVVCNNALNAAIKEYNLTDPGQILDKTRDIVVEQFNKSTTVNTSGIRDGMDIALCVLNKKTNEIFYAGGYNSLWVIKNETNKIEEVKADRQSIGKTESPQPFKTNIVQLNTGDQIYLFSDGFVDQFGGEKGRKMMNKRFKELLMSIRKESLEDQHEKINVYFEEWKGSHEQIDDVCVMGVKF
ncbi:MAG: tetratricopeptide repeat protein [Vicingaceae bacterium]|nr:tetratricopeptide repeat protein [Vicingaceae bacterium]